MNRRTIILTAIGAGTVALIGTAGMSVASSTSDDVDVAITGPALEEASAAALAHTGEGTVTDTEVGDEDSLYEVEVTLDDGTEVDVQLDEDFAVVSADADDPNEADD